MAKLSSFKKKYLINGVVIGAVYYERHLNKKRFIIITEDLSINTITFLDKDFHHLSGLKLNVGSDIFYQLSLNNKLALSNIRNIQTYDYKTLKNKNDALRNLNKFLFTDASTNLFLIDLVTKTETFPVAIRNDSEDMTIAFKGKDLHARSLRKAKNSKNCTKQLLIYAIFQIEENDALASNIVYLKDAETILTNFKDLDKYVNQELIIDLKERLKKKTQR